MGCLVGLEQFHEFRPGAVPGQFSEFFLFHILGGRQFHREQGDVHPACQHRLDGFGILGEVEFRRLPLQGAPHQIHPVHPAADLGILKQAGQGGKRAGRDVRNVIEGLQPVPCLLQAAGLPELPAGFFRFFLQGTGQAQEPVLSVEAFPGGFPFLPFPGPVRSVVRRQVQIQHLEGEPQIGAGLFFRSVPVGGQHQIRHLAAAFHHEQCQGIVAARIHLRRQGRFPGKVLRCRRPRRQGAPPQLAAQQSPQHQHRRFFSVQAHCTGLPSSKEPWNSIVRKEAGDKGRPSPNQPGICYNR